jgi:hypothetical protein
VDEDIRLGALDFDQLIEKQELSFRAALSESRKSLRTTNEDITLIEDQLQPVIHLNMEEQLRLKLKQLSEHDAIRPIEILNPTEQHTSEQSSITVRLTDLTRDLFNAIVLSIFTKVNCRN